MHLASPTAAPMVAGAAVQQGLSKPLSGDTPYSELVGSILYLATTTRPDIAYATGVLARYMKAPEHHHWQAAKTVVRYLIGTKGVGLLYGGGTELTGAVEADYGGCPGTRRSTTGWLFTLNGGAISWSSRRQATVAASTAEAEYIAAAGAAKEALWLRKLMADLRLPVGAVAIAEDNQACMAMATNPEGTGRAKHIDIAHHLVRERTATGEVSLVPVRSSEQPADGLTKALTGPAFTTFRLRMGVTDGEEELGGEKEGTDL